MSLGGSFSLRIASSHILAFPRKIKGPTLPPSHAFSPILVRVSWFREKVGGKLSLLALLARRGVRAQGPFGQSPEARAQMRTRTTWGEVLRETSGPRSS